MRKMFSIWLFTPPFLNVSSQMQKYFASEKVSEN